MQWYAPKVLRLYISLFIVAIIYVIVGYRKPSFELFLFPIHQFWFVPIIVNLYILYYLAMRGRTIRNVILLIDIAAYLIIYIFVFDRSEFFVERHFYFLIMYGYVAMLIGAKIKERLTIIETLEAKKSLLLIGVSMLCIMGFLGSKLWIATKSQTALNLQLLTQVFSMGFAVFFVIGVAKYDQKIEKLLKNNLVGKLIHIISISTFEIYLIQYVLIFNLKSYRFPANFFLIVIAVVAGGALIHRVSNRIYKKVMRLLYD